jgi:hypothetical protein
VFYIPSLRKSAKDGAPAKTYPRAKAHFASGFERPKAKALGSLDAEEEAGCREVCDLDAEKEAVYGCDSDSLHLVFFGCLGFVRGSAMRAMTLGLVAVLAFVVAGTGAWAQTPCGVMVSVGARTYGPQPKANAPYSATVQTTHEQKLADGNTIHGSVTTHQARDSAGRMMTEIASGCVIGPDGKSGPVVRVSVYDPATRTTLSWAVNDSSAFAKVVRVMHPVEPAPVAPPTPEQRQQQMAQARQRRQQSEYHNEALGSRNIEGVTAEGTRTTHTIRAGEMGNDQPIEIVDEIWIDKDLGLAMLSVNDSPMNGRTTTQVMELNQSEPDAALFAAPAGYKLEEQVVKSVSAVGSQ